MRLIDADVLKSHIKAVIKKQNGGDVDLVPIGELLTFIGMEPTAYDVDAVVERLKDLKNQVPVNRILDDIINDKPKELGQLIAYDKAIEIVKGGGVDAKTNS